MRRFVGLFAIAFAGGLCALLLEKIAELWAIAIANAAVVDAVSKSFGEALAPLRTKIE